MNRYCLAVVPPPPLPFNAAFFSALARRSLDRPAFSALLTFASRCGSLAISTFFFDLLVDAPRSTRPNFANRKVVFFFPRLFWSPFLARLGNVRGHSGTAVTPVLSWFVAFLSRNPSKDSRLCLLFVSSSGRIRHFYFPHGSRQVCSLLRRMAVFR